ncbi:zinc finger CCCH domain-containing protein 3-like [Coregonus clupeaformis]|uniref:zinc finger CCCH domain-containing protein 3-like n=1 Tax=Coregonus clupeaformis TaxID=59861 RepID=UPI001BDFFBA9|nr:zinc finger CCCH domain-containing protein 3-like [Coregonus clupeaformis]
MLIRRSPRNSTVCTTTAFCKCNRGNTCPYIHYPDWVAICTRFLGGTCKQTGGTCPFSHKVAKEKVKLCGNKHTHNDLECKKKHTLVCPDFSSSGSFPRGAQCKKKHTLVCPDFSSSGSFPRGAQCQACQWSYLMLKLQRVLLRQIQGHPRPLPWVLTTPSSRPSSPSPTPPKTQTPPDTPLADGAEVTERILQIKPRF